jgi:hypothetical protein
MKCWLRYPKRKRKNFKEQPKTITSRSLLTNNLNDQTAWKKIQQNGESKKKSNQKDSRKMLRKKRKRECLKR